MFQLISTIVVSLLIVASIESKLRIDSEWRGAFYAGIDIPVVRNVTDDEWEVAVRFDQPVTIDVSAMTSSSRISEYGSSTT